MVDKKISALTAKTTPVDADSVPIYDSENTDTRQVTMTNLKAFLKTYFDTIYGGNFVAAEVPGGTGTARTLAHTPISGSLKVFDGAVALHPTTDYTLSGTDLTFVVAPDNPVIYYKYA